MENNESPKSLTEVIDRLKDDLVRRFPDQWELIVSYAESSPKVISCLLREGKSLDDICSVFTNLDRFNSGKMNQKVRDEIRAIRIMLGEQIRLGKIALPDPKNQ